MKDEAEDFSEHCSTYASIAFEDSCYCASAYREVSHIGYKNSCA